MIFSAHGVSTAVEQEARAARLSVFDATCPLVTKVHMEVTRFAREARDVVLIGHAGHPEVEGTMGRFDTVQGGRIHLVENLADVARSRCAIPQRLAFVTQTTLSVDDTAAIVAALRRALPGAAGAAQGRHLLRDPEPAGRGQAAARAVRRAAWSWARARSSNSNRLRELADRAGVPGYLVDGAEDLRARVVHGQQHRRRHRRGLGAGAAGAAGGRAAQGLGRGGPQEVQGREEHVFFTLPRELRRDDSEESV